jgi:hypothetical protein
MREGDEAGRFRNLLWGARQVARCLGGARRDPGDLPVAPTIFERMAE